MLQLTGRTGPAGTPHIEALRGLGVRIAIDGFTTDATTMSQLRHLPADIVKLDQSFIDEDPTLASLAT